MLRLNDSTLRLLWFERRAGNIIIYVLLRLKLKASLPNESRKQNSGTALSVIYNGFQWRVLRYVVIWGRWDFLHVFY